MGKERDIGIDQREDRADTLTMADLQQRRHEVRAGEPGHDIGAIGHLEGGGQWVDVQGNHVPGEIQVAIGLAEGAQQLDAASDAGEEKVDR